MNPEVELQIRNNISWSKLPTNIRQLVGNSQKEYEKSIVSYCIRNQLRFKDTLVRYVRKDEKKYYEELLQYSKEHYMLYPYHLSDLFVRGLRITPFNYYLDMMANLMLSEKSYDTLPNFTAFDCVRLLGIGRNQYIDIMNRFRSANNKSRISFTRRKPNIRSLLPTQPIDILIEPWWLVNVGCVAEDDVRTLSEDEKNCIDCLIDNQKPIAAGKLNYDSVNSLYRKGLVYLDVPLNENDYVEVPPLESFVMNRILGDYFETLLYKLFVSIDDHTSLGELASLLQIDVDLVLNAVSLYCRLSFAVKKQKQDDNLIEGLYDSTWKDYRKRIKKNLHSGETLLDWKNGSDDMSDSETKLLSTSSLETELKLTNEINSGSNSVSSNKKRIGFLFDSTLTAFLMMGNLSSGLKNHAVTMFEVGKLSDQALDNFVNELEKVSNEQSEGEAQRYFDHARILKSTIQFLRYNSQLKIFSGFHPKNPISNETITEKKEQEVEKELTEEEIPIENEPLGLDLLRCESLMSLDEDSRQRILAKNYSILFSMAPYSNSGESNNSAPITCDFPFHIGPAIPEMNSVWFKLFLYELTGDGPLNSLLLPKGYRLNSLPEKFIYFEKFMIITWGHDPIIVPHSNLLITLNDALTHSPILVECYSESEEGARTINIAFNDSTHPLFNHPSVQIIHDKLNLKYFSGYITLLNPHNNLNMIEEGYKEKFEEWHIMDLHYGIPLFDNKLNLNILSLFKENNLGSYENLNSMLQTNRWLSLELINFIQKNQIINVVEKNFFDVPDKTENYLIPILASKSSKRLNQSRVVIYPTQCILFEDKQIKIINDL